MHAGIKRLKETTRKRTRKHNKYTLTEESVLSSVLWPSSMSDE